MGNRSSSRWTPDRARSWAAERGWRVGCNFTPSTASNPIEMWREATFDLPTITREMDLAAGIGFTSLRVFLHDLVWREDPEGMLQRMEVFLAASAERGIGILWVFFDGVWNPHPTPGAQPEPRPRVHNAGWVQSPGAAVLGDSARQDELQPYVTSVVEHFRDDERVDGWDLFNEPDNPNPAYANVEIPDKAERALELSRKAVEWTRAVGPVQPITIGVWQGGWGDDASPMTRFSLEESDVISFHWYGALDEMRERVSALRGQGRPIWCTEFMARTMGNRFDPHLGWMHDEGIGAYCWGLVAGRTQTHYPWDSWVKTYEGESDPWFHEVFRPDGTPYDEAEAAYIRARTT